MQTHKAKRVVFTIEKIMMSRLTKTIEDAGVTGYSILPVYGGSGRSGFWTRELLETTFAVVEKHIGVVSITDCEVLRAERF